MSKTTSGSGTVADGGMKEEKEELGIDGGGSRRCVGPANINIRV